MFNENLFNTVTFNVWSPFAFDSITDDIIFNWFGFQNANVVTSFKDDQNFAWIELNTFQNPIVDGGWVLNRRFTQRDITLKWVLKTTTASEMETLIDYFKLKTSAVEGYLDIKVDWIYRRTKASCVKSDIFKRSNHDITRCPFEITFRTVDPFFYLRTKTTYIEASVSSDINIDIQYPWNAKAYPKLYFFFWPSVSWTTAISVEANGSKIEISETISNGDLLIIDCLEKTVTVNWTWIEYSWSFPYMENWSNVFDININWTFTCDISILYPKNFL